jgi:RNA polymerase sigma factor (sigma-70 family)
MLFFKNIDKFDETRPLRPYLFGIARHVLYDHSEEVKNHPEADLLEDIEYRPAGSPRHERLSLNEAEVSAVLKWIEENISLSDFQRRTVALRTKGFTPQEIAYLLNDTARRVSRELQRARKKIQARLHRRDFAGRGSDEEA